MKELEDFKANQIGVEIKAEAEQKKEIKLIGQQRKVPGLTLWEYNENTKELTKAKFQKVNVMIHGLGMSPESITNTHKVIVNENCVYFQALNRANALRKISKSL